MKRPPSYAISNTPSFFKILLDSNATHLGLPVEFVKNHMKGSIPEHPKLKTRSGKTWDLKIKERDGKYCFVDGWNKVMHDNNLQFGDFLVFWLIDRSTFHALFFGPSGCEKSHSQPDVCVKLEEYDDDDDGDNDNGDDDDDGDNYNDDDDDEQPVDALEEPYIPCFQKILSKSHRIQLGFPAKFVKETGIVRGESIKMMVIEDPRGKKWRVRLLAAKDGRFFLSYGWKDLVQKNDIVVGDICIFQLMSQGYLVLKVVKKRSLNKRKVAVDGISPNPLRKVGRRSAQSSSQGASRVEGGYIVKRKRGRPPLKSKRV